MNMGRLPAMTLRPVSTAVGRSVCRIAERRSPQLHVARFLLAVMPS